MRSIIRSEAKDLMTQEDKLTKIRDAISLEDLKKYAAEPEAANASTVPQSRKGNNLPGGVPTKERTELAGTDEMTGSRQRGNY